MTPRTGAVVAKTRDAGTSATAPALERAIGPVAATLLVIGGIVGSGIFLTTGIMAAALPSPSLILLAWVCGGLFALAGALTYAEMSAMFPRAGGVYVFLSEAFGPLAGFMYGWSMLLVVLSGGVAAVAVGFADYLSYFAPSLAHSHVLVRVPIGAWTWTLSAGQIVAVASILALGGINYLGVRSGSGTNALLTTTKMAGLVLLAVFALLFANVQPAWTPVVPAAVASPFVAFGIAMIAVLWANDGFYFLTYAAGEVRDPTRNVPRALTLGLLSVMAIYLAVNLAYLVALPMSELAGTSRVAERAATALVGPSGATVVALTVVLSTFGCNAAAILAGSRLLYAMAADGRFLRPAAAVHPRYRSPHIAIAAITIWSSLLALSGSYEQLFTYVVFTSVIFSLCGGLALFRLRVTRPSQPRPYRVFGYPLVPALFVLGSVFVLYNTLRERPVESIAGLGLLLIGLPAYFYWRRD
jgi:APA family basic amino acid/polyamine antiporter